MSVGFRACAGGVGGWLDKDETGLMNMYSVGLF